MKRQAHDVQYTVRGIPKEVDRALRRKAAQRKLSLNQVIVRIARAKCLERDESCVAAAAA